MITFNVAIYVVPTLILDSDTRRDNGPARLWHPIRSPLSLGLTLVWTLLTPGLAALFLSAKEFRHNDVTTPFFPYNHFSFYCV